MPASLYKPQETTEQFRDEAHGRTDRHHHLTMISIHGLCAKNALMKGPGIELRCLCGWNH